MGVETPMIRKLLALALLLGAAPAAAETLLLKPAAVFDGVNPPHAMFAELIPDVLNKCQTPN